MTSLSFPDLNVWIAIAAQGHSLHAAAGNWWKQYQGSICFSRFTQLGFLRLTTTAAAMEGKPLAIAGAWQAYEWFFQDDRVIFMPEPPEVEIEFRHRALAPSASPKVWADAWILSFAAAAGGTVITFDRALRSRGAQCLL